jgi:sialic acid synthase SpsE
MNRIYIIAEMAYSHDGSPELAKQVVKDAVAAGADAISIHITSVPDYASKFYKSGEGRVSAGKENKPFFDYLTEISLSFEEWTDVVSVIREHNLDLLVMPNDRPSLEFATNLAPEAYVIPASNFDEEFFVREVGAHSKPVYLRVGGASLGEIENVIRLLGDAGSGAVTLLYGHQNYPTTIKDTNIGFIPYLQNAFGLPVGIADHVDGGDDFALVAPLLAVPLGISCVEKHLTYDRSKRGEDFEAALDKESFKKFVQFLRKTEAAVQDKGLFKFTEDTEAYRQTLRKRVIASRDLKVGEVITEKMIANKRSDEGIFPSQTPTILGLTLYEDVAMDRGITFGLFRKKD